ncbi:hypothetical protein QBC39DRAFT_85643 [Podospora conica]|nr:hypothetical protein QBC39DRAFT_85643 [Schizothecium conicum]
MKTLDWRRNPCYDGQLGWLCSSSVWSSIAFTCSCSRRWLSAEQASVVRGGYWSRSRSSHGGRWRWKIRSVFVPDKVDCRAGYLDKLSQYLKPAIAQLKTNTTPTTPFSLRGPEPATLSPATWLKWTSKTTEPIKVLCGPRPPTATWTRAPFTWTLVPLTWTPVSLTWAVVRWLTPASVRCFFVRAPSTPPSRFLLSRVLAPCPFYLRRFSPGKRPFHALRKFRSSIIPKSFKLGLHLPCMSTASDYSWTQFSGFQWTRLHPPSITRLWPHPHRNNFHRGRHPALFKRTRQSPQPTASCSSRRQIRATLGPDWHPLGHQGRWNNSG